MVRLANPTPRPGGPAPILIIREMRALQWGHSALAPLKTSITAAGRAPILLTQVKQPGLRRESRRTPYRRSFMLPHSASV
jgi:hypothetical protein